MWRRALFILLLTLFASHMYLGIVKAGDEPAASASPLRVDVERRVALLDGGYIMINDVFSFSVYEDDASATVPSPFLIGIPSKYYENLVYYVARDPEKNISVNFAGKDEYFGWFGISLPEVNVSKENTYNFTLTLVLSGLIERKSDYMFRAEFPLYPSLGHGASSCNVTVMLPATARQINYPRDILAPTNKTNELYSFVSPLTERANVSSWVEFRDNYFSIIRILEMKREIVIEGLGGITVTDTYDIKIANLQRLTVILPGNSTNIVVYDSYGKYREQDLLITSDGGGTKVMVFLSEQLKRGDRARIAVSYSLPFWAYVKKNGWQNYELRINVTRPDEWIIDKITIVVILPEGASFIQGGRPVQLKCERAGLFQDKIFIEYYNVTRYEDLSPLNIKYQYAVFWVAFRPTILAITLVGFASIVVAFITSAGKVEVKATVIPTGILREFIEVCEERMRVSSEIETLREQFVKGKLAKRQYQLTRKMFDERLSILQRKFLELKAKIEAAGGNYAKMVRQLEEAIANIEEANRGIEEADLKYRMGKISGEERQRILEENSRRKGRMKSIIDEVLLKLKEDITSWG